MTALCFVNVIKKMISMLKENSIPKNSKDATQFGGKFFKSIDIKFLMVQLNKPVKFQQKLVAYLDTIDHDNRPFYSCVLSCQAFDLE